MSALLEVEDLRVNYGKVEAVSNDLADAAYALDASAVRLVEESDL